MTEAVQLGYLTLVGIIFVAVAGIVGPLLNNWSNRRAALAAAAASKAAADLIVAEMAGLKQNMDGHMSKIIAMSEEAAANAAEVKGRDKEIAAQDARTSKLVPMIKEVGAKVDAVAAVVVNGVPTVK